MTSPRSPRFTDEPGLRFGLATAAIVVLLLGGRLTGLGDDATIAVVGATSLGLAAALPRLLAPCLTLVAWAFVTGFVVNGQGLLTFQAADLHRLGAFTLVGLLGALLPRGASLAEARTRARSRLYRGDPPLTARARPR